MSKCCKHCRVYTRNACSDYKGRNRFEGCYNLSDEEQLTVLYLEGDRRSGEMLELIEENRRLRNR